MSFCSITVMKYLKIFKCLSLFRHKLYSESSSENNYNSIQCKTQFSMLFNSNVLLSDVYIMISVNSVSIIEDINISSEYLYSAMLLRSISEKVEKRLFKVALSYSAVLSVSALSSISEQKWKFNLQLHNFWLTSLIFIIFKNSLRSSLFILCNLFSLILSASFLFHYRLSSTSLKYIYSALFINNNELYLLFSSSLLLSGQTLTLIICWELTLILLSSLQSELSL